MISTKRAKPKYYRFTPQPHITAYELAIIVRKLITSNGLTAEIMVTDESEPEFAAVSKHFTEIELD